MIRTVIIEDEQHLREVNRILLTQNFADIDIVGEADSVETGIEIIEKTKPQLVLLDIELRGGTSFQILQKLKPYNFKVVFITAYNQFALKAIKFSALDYILKPVNETEFCAAIQKAIEQIETEGVNIQMQNFFEHLDKINRHKKLVLRTADSIHLIDISEIVYCRSDNSYTTFYFDNKKEIIVSKGIKEYEDALTEYNFFRPHQSFLVNLNHIEKIDKTDGGFIILKNGKEIPVSSRRKATLIQLIESI